MLRPAVVALAVLAVVSCARKAQEATPPGHAHAEDPPAEPGAAHEGHDHAAEEGEEEAEGSPLDRPLDELKSERCEHEVATFECDECRYEVGFVRVGPSVLEGGLVRLETVGLRRPETSVTLDAELVLDDRRLAHVRPRTRAIVAAVNVRIGDTVAAGEPLLQLTSLELGEAQGALAEARARRTFARKTLDRLTALRRDKLVAEKDWLAARESFEAADIQRRTAADKLLRLGLTEEELAAFESDGLRHADGAIVLRAPLSGTVLELHAVQGELVEPSEAFVTLADTRALWGWARLAERDMADVLDHMGRGDLAARVSVAAFPGVSFPATAEQIAPRMDEETRTVRLRLAVPNPDGKLLAGMFARVDLDLGSGPVIAVPKEAVLQDGGRDFVFVPLGADLFAQRQVRVGHGWGPWVEVREGLAEGDRVVGRGAFLLKSDVLRSKMGAGCAD